ncbi:MAG: acetate--CoA ligase family protein [Verrucomicrobia bacterium]|jgi:acetyltransferase|nr:acetate--CoA ligase family protein [Verrucomicrobiota bacterium]OQC67666.1 MAG: Succinyl-CoA ligase (ADP-forming) subunit alpha [Verrucomicrobia bacterium ADurb.Bin006]MDI9380881.1 acetate--CoA ligase family protein [Verrucomicrobiota bacterium]NMD20732.1 CoA-binding protein [Verrucomicrobiota bacterium]HOA61814.1 acetate--CoA ligase family protein [Verrucomicrobiota bacterium]
MLETLLYPRTVAVIGASRNPEKVGYAFMHNLTRGGFKGTIVPINLEASEILGVKCYKSLAEYGGKIDLSVVVVGGKYVRQAIQDSIDAGAKTVIVITAGFKEVGAKGAEAEKELVALCQAHGVRMMGPNCLGVLNTHHAMNATFAPTVPPPGRISVISQSGALCVAILDWAASQELGLGKVISFGNKADLNEVDFIQALAEDKETRVIAGYLESIKEGDKFLRVAEQAAGVKPVVVLKVGTTQAGAKAASSHTGSLAGADIAYGAAFKRSGVIRAENFEALFDYAMAFSTQPLPAGERVCVITNAGGPGIMAADAAETMGLKMVIPSDATKERLRAVLPPTASFGNPVDVIGDAEPERYLKAFEILQEDDTIDAILVVATPQNMTRPLELAEKLAAANKGKKPLLTAFMGGQEVAAGKARLMELGIPNYPAPDRAVAALRAMCDYAAWRRRPARIVSRFPVNHRRVDRVIQWHIRSEIEQVGEVEAKDILRAYDFKILPGALAKDADEAVEVANRIGYPVVLKISSPDIIHKSDFGGVRVNLAAAEQVRDAFDLMMLRVQRRAPNAFIRGAYVEKMGHRGREVILGMTRDPQFGPMLMFGLGGIFVEVMKDVTFHLAPITQEEAMQMLMGTRSYALLKGARGQAPVDLHALASALQRISQLATDYPEIRELDINPYIVGEVGTEAYAADARMTLSKLAN